jgi:hypothetical protein
MKKIASMGLLRSAVFTCVVAVAGAPLVLADEPTSPPAPSDKPIQERAVPMQKSLYLNVPRMIGPRAPIPPRGGTMNFSCGTTSCTCHGDADCNNMFSSNVCGRSAVCDTSSGVECSCLRQ